MTCPYLNQDPNRKKSCKLGVCIEWVDWFFGIAITPRDSDEFCLKQKDYFKPTVELVKK